VTAVVADRYLLRRVFQPAPWTADAACRDLHPAPWFPERGQPADTAKAVCASSPVRVECLDYALANYERHGVWGGMTEHERRRLRRARARAPAA
jgi:WhiB family redox-sensing transcriptional regulator